MTKALDTYIEENNIQKVNPKNKEYLINRAGLLYRRSLENPVFSRISGYFNTVKKYLLPFNTFFQLKFAIFYPFFFLLFI